jgi:hypothetical protein
MSGVSFVRLEAFTNCISDGVGRLHEKVYCATLLDIYSIHIP